MFASNNYFMSNDFFGDNEFLCNKRTMMLLNKMRKNSLGTKEDILEVEMKVIN